MAETAVNDAENDHVRVTDRAFDQNSGQNRRENGQNARLNWNGGHAIMKQTNKATTASRFSRFAESLHQRNDERQTDAFK